MTRRLVVMQERIFLQDAGVVTEMQCDLGEYWIINRGFKDPRGTPGEHPPPAPIFFHFEGGIFLKFWID